MCPDIFYAVSQPASFLDCYQPEYWTTAIQVLCYLKCTRTLALVLGRTRYPLLLGYSDANYINYKDTS